MGIAIGVDITIPRRRSGSVQVEDIPDLEMWLKSEDLAAVGDGNPLASWVDATGNGHTFTASGAGRPTVRQNGIGGAWSAEFAAGGPNFMTASSGVTLASSTGYSIFILHRLLGFVNARTALLGSNAVLNDLPAALNSVSTAQGRGNVQYNVGGGANTSAAATYLINTNFVSEWGRNAAGLHYHFKDGVDITNGTFNNTNSFAASIMGRAQNSADDYIGHIGEILVFTRKVTDDERTLVADHLLGLI